MYNALGHLQNGAPESQLLDSKKTEADNVCYQNEKYGDLAKVKKGLLTCLYGVKNMQQNETYSYHDLQEGTDHIYKSESVVQEGSNDEYIPSESKGHDLEKFEKTEFQVAEDTLKESPDFPLIKRLSESGYIQSETILELSKKLDDSQRVDTDYLKQIDIPDEYTSYFDANTDMKDKSANLEDFFAVSEGFPELQTMKQEYDQVSSDDNLNQTSGSIVFEKIGSHFHRIIDQNGETNDRADLDCALGLTKESILAEFGKNINQNTLTFTHAIDQIDSGNISQQLEGIETLYILGEGTNAISGARMEKSKQLVKNYSEKQLQKLGERYLVIQSEILVAQKNGESQKEKKLYQELAETNQMGEELYTGNVFSGGEIDQLSENDNNIQEGA